MSELIAIPSTARMTPPAPARSARSRRRRDRAEDTAVVTKGADGKVQVKNEMASSTETGAVR
jgi:uncharacterized membrane protein